MPKLPPRSRSILVLASCALAVAVASPPVTAEGWDFGARTGYYTDAEEFFLGIEALHQIGDTPWMFNPNAEYVFVENGSLWALSADVHYDFDLDLDKVDVWAGAGPTILFRDFDRGLGNDDSESDFGLNLIAGAGAKEGGVRPYGQIKVIVSGDTEVALQVGLRFY